MLKSKRSNFINCSIRRKFSLYLNSKPLKSQLKKNVIFSSFVFVANAFLLFLSYPLYLYYLGIELFGVWTLLSIVISFVEISNLGMGDALVKFVSAERETNRNYIQMYFAAALLIIVILMTVIAPFFLFFPKLIVEFLSIPLKYYELSTQLIPYLLIISFLYLIMDSLRAVLTGLGRLDLSNVIFLVGNFLKISFSIILFLGGLKIWGLFFASVISLLIMMFGYIYFIFKNSNIFILHIMIPSIRIIRTMLGFGGVVFGSQVLSMIMMPIIKIIIASSTGMSFVTYFEIGSKIPYIFRSFFEKGLYAIFPEISMLNLLPSNKNSVKNIVQGSVRFLLFVSLPFSLIMILTSTLWMQIWLGSSYSYEVVKCFVIIMVGMIVSLIALPFYYGLLGIGFVKYSFYESLIRVTINLILIALIVGYDLSSTFLYSSFAVSTIISNLYIIKIGRKRIF